MSANQSLKNIKNVLIKRLSLGSLEEPACLKSFLINTFLELWCAHFVYNSLFVFCSWGWFACFVFFFFLINFKFNYLSLCVYTHTHTHAHARTRYSSLDFVWEHMSSRQTTNTFKSIASVCKCTQGPDWYVPCLNHGINHVSVYVNTNVSLTVSFESVYNRCWSLLL